MPTSPDAAIKGLSFVSCINTVKRRVNPPTFARFLAALDDEVRSIAVNLPSANEWLPLRYIDHTISVAYEHAYERSPELMFEHGRDGVRADVRGVYAVFARALSVEFSVRRASQMWKTYYRGNGELAVRSFDPAAKVFELSWTGTIMTSEEFWHTNAGGVRGLGDVIRMRDFDLVFTDGGPGCTHAVVRGSWS